MTFLNLSHVAIGVKDMDRSLAFYRDVIGLDVRSDQIEETTSKTGINNFKRRAAYLWWSDGPSDGFIVLDQQLTHAAPGEPKRLFDIGVHHFSFWVDDIDPILARARADMAGQIVYNDEVDGGSDSYWYGETPGASRIRTMIMRDPDGNLVQFDQRARAQ